MRKLLLWLLFAPFLALAQPYTYPQLTNIVATELPSNTNNAIRATNFWNVYDAILQSLPLAPIYTFPGIAAFDPATGMRLDVLPDATGGESDVAWDPVTKIFRKTSKSVATYGLSSLGAGQYTIASPTPAYGITNVYPDGMSLYFRVGGTAGGAETLKLGSGPAKPIKLPDLTVVPVGDLVSNSVGHVVFSTISDAWILQDSASGLQFDSTMYAAINGPTVTVGVPTNGLPVNRLATMAANTLLGNPTGSTATPTAITLGANLSFSGGALQSSSGATTSTTIFNDYLVTNANGVSVIICDATTNNITVTLPQDSEERSIMVLKKDNTANIVFVVNGGGDAYQNGLGVSPIKLMLRGEYVRTRGIGSNLNMVLDSNSIDLGTLNDMRNYTMLFKSEFADNTVASFWGQNGMSTASYTTDPSHGYISTFTTSTLNNGMGYFGLRNASVQLNVNNPIVLTFDFLLGTLPTAGVEDFVVELGLVTALASTGTDLSDTDCVVFRYNVNENSGKFRVRVCANGAGNSLYTNESTITPAANTWYRVTMVMSSQIVYVIVNDVVIGPITTGIPTAATMTIGGKIQKIAGTTARLLSMDYFKSARTAIR